MMRNEKPGGHGERSVAVGGTSVVPSLQLGIELNGYYDPYVSDGDLLSITGDVCARNADLLRAFDVKTDLGLDAVDILDVERRLVAGAVAALGGAVLQAVVIVVSAFQLLEEISQRDLAALVELVPADGFKLDHPIIDLGQRTARHPDSPA